MQNHSSGGIQTSLPWMMKFIRTGRSIRWSIMFRLALRHLILTFAWGFNVSGIPVIFMTAKVQAHEVDRYKVLGALGVISKPFDPMTLADLVRQIWKP